MFIRTRQITKRTKERGLQRLLQVDAFLGADENVVKEEKPVVFVIIDPFGANEEKESELALEFVAYGFSVALIDLGTFKDEATLESKRFDHALVTCCLRTIGKRSRRHCCDY